MRAIVLVQRYSLELTNQVERAVGVGMASNHELQLLTYLHGYGPTSRKDLVAVTNSSRSSLTQMLKRLELLGLLSSHTSPQDHRKLLSELTLAGRRRVKRVEHAMDEYFMSPNPMVKELVALLGEMPSPSSLEPLSTIAAIDRLASLGTILSARAEATTGLADTRQRLALALAADWGEVRPTQLAEELGLTSGGTTYLVDQLESGGLLERLYGTVPTDRRAVVIRLTASGREACEQFADILYESADDLIPVLLAAHRQL
jgi:DNA-binding MarR family transcriptional regulator